MASIFATEHVAEQPSREALWRGKHITYRPGRLHIGLRRGVSHKVAYNLLVKAGCQIEYDSFNCGVFEVSVSPKDTLRLASILGTNSLLFRYVEPEILDKENFN